MTKMLAFIGCTLICATAVCQKKSQEFIKNSMSRNVDSLLMDPKIYGVSMGIYKDGELYTEHYGELDRGQGNLPTDETLYEIASVTKTFTGTLVAKAVVDGKLNLNDDIRQYLKNGYPNLEFQGSPITIRHLVTHTSRLPAFLPDTINELFEARVENLPKRINEILSDQNEKKFLDNLRLVALDTLPGYTYSYSNAGTELVAHILETVYDKTYEVLLKDFIFIPSGMKYTKLHIADEDYSNLAKGHWDSNETIYAKTALWGADGGLKSNMHDLAKYMRFQMDSANEMAVKSHEALFIKSPSSKIGYFWQIGNDAQDGTYYFHHGGAYGFQNYMFLFPKYDLGISIIVNQGAQGTGTKLLKVINGLLDDLR